jgi:hypothetical protein
MLALWATGNQNRYVYSKFDSSSTNTTINTPDLNTPPTMNAFMEAQPNETFYEIYTKQ